MVRSLQSPKVRKPQKFWAIALMSMMMVGGLSETVASSAAIAATPAGQAIAQRDRSTLSDQVPRRVARRIQRDAARRFEVHPRDVRIISAQRQTWPDGCLGLAADNERCTMALIEGWRVVLTDGQQTWTYRTDRQAQFMRVEEEAVAALPATVVDRLFATIARQANVPANTLRVVESQPRTWDGCMGIYEPNQGCTRIAISGYRVIVMGDRQSWVYHTNADGSQVVQNTTASGSSSRITPSFIPAASQPPMPSNDIVFKMTVSGGLAGDITETVLTQDGTLYRTSTRMQASVNSAPTIIKRLSPQQLQQFQQVLTQQKFPNLNGMQYLTSAVLADYPTTTVQAMGGTVSYVDLEESGLPQSLQAVIQAWNRL